MDVKKKIASPTLLCFLFAMLFASFSFSQNSVLNKKVSITINNQPLELALNKMSEEGGFNFSYNPDLLPLDSNISIAANNQPIESILDDLLGSQYTFLPSGNHIIIQPNQQQEKKKVTAAKKIDYTISGSVTDWLTGEKIKEVTVYDINELESALTDEEGNFTLQVTSSKKQLPIVISKLNYLDTVITITPLFQEDIEVSLFPKKPIDKMELKKLKTVQMEQKREVEELKIVKVLVPEEQRIVSKNILTDLEKIPIQISLLPNIGTNRLISGSLINIISINIISGYSYGVAGVELGGVLNIIRNNVIGVQAGGFGNIVGEKVKGVQMAGFFNKTGGSIVGVQMAGFANYANDTIIGIQAAGFSNVLKGRINGLQMAGFSNLTLDSSVGMQAAGFSNIAKGEMNGMQIAGFHNSATEDFIGLQMAGFINIANKNVQGSQISGFINIAKKVSGVQIGFINIADSVGGVSFGFLNLIKNGYKRWEINTNDALLLNLLYKNGSTKFYNILAVGSRFENNNTIFSYGYGVGTQPKLTNKLRLNVELIGNHLMDESYFTHIAHFNLLSKFNTHLNIALFNNKVGLSVGPTLNYYLHEKTTDYIPSTFINATTISNTRNFAAKAWIGGQVGINF